MKRLKVFTNLKILVCERILVKSAENVTTSSQYKHQSQNLFTTHLYFHFGQLQK